MEANDERYDMKDIIHINWFENKNQQLWSNEKLFLNISNNMLYTDIQQHENETKPIEMIIRWNKTYKSIPKSVWFFAVYQWYDDIMIYKSTSKASLQIVETKHTEVCEKVFQKTLKQNINFEISLLRKKINLEKVFSEYFHCWT